MLTSAGDFQRTTCRIHDLQQQGDVRGPLNTVRPDCNTSVPAKGHGAGSLVRSRTEERTVEVVLENLLEVGVPHLLAEQLVRDDQSIGMRIYLLDNSGSMNAGDGHTFADIGGGTLVMQRSTRWEETCDLARQHAKWNAAINVPCEFQVLNSTVSQGSQRSQEGVDYVRLESGHGSFEDLDTFLLRNNPRGVTPISERLSDIRRRIEAEARELAARGQIIFLTIVTDGLPTSSTSGTSTKADQKKMVDELRRLTSDLPVQLVIRLCTDDDEVVKFYDEVDEEFELPMDVLDDLYGEARQIAEKGNDWFVYSPLLHRIREAGTLCKLLDDLDERRLRPLEARRLAELLAPSCTNRPLSQRDDSSFLRAVGCIVRSAPPVYDPLSRQLRPFVDLWKFGAALRGGGILAGLCSWYEQQLWPAQPHNDSVRELVF